MDADSASTEDPQPVGNEAATDEATGARTKKRSPVVRYLSILGPGLVTGASDDDPSGIATYAQAGATYSNSMLWTVPLTAVDDGGAGNL
ncbi:hypothetical protein NHF46_10845 [Arthrobacter alpinus]|nr:hypothetical protein [Arthrobacter alpinus]